MTTASTDQCKDHAHHKPERAELDNMCREATSHRSLRLLQTIIVPLQAQDVGRFALHPAQVQIHGYGGSAKARAQHTQRRCSTCCSWHPELVAPFHPLIPQHITALPLSLLPQPHQTCLAEAVFSTIPNQVNREEPTRKMA